ncbi:hypothetical protein BAE44_0024858, partial [Dichanthelium oligosanthes]
LLHVLVIFVLMNLLVLL